MPRESAFQSFLKEFQIEPGKPASAAQIQKLEKKLGFALPESLRECFLVCNGGKAARTQPPRSAVELHSLNSALDYQRVPGFLDSLWGFFPFMENNDSNPVCISCKGPLAGYVVLVSHDDAPRLLFRSLDKFFNAAIKHLQGAGKPGAHHAERDGYFDTYDLPAEFAEPKRTKQDQATARKLLDLVAQGGPFQFQERTDALRFACDLLADDQVDEIAALLKDDDQYVREHATRRLQGMKGAKAKKALSQSTGDFDAFVERCAQRLQREGLRSSVQAPYGSKTIRIDPGPVWLNMEMFFSERKRPDIEDYVVDRARFFVENEKAGR